MEYDLHRLVQLIKKAAMEAVRAENPMRIAYGKVVSSAPLKIQIDSRTTLTEEFLDIPISFTNHEIIVELAGVDTKYLVKNALRAGDKVTLIQQAGGQKYVVIDRRAADVT